MSNKRTELMDKLEDTVDYDDIFGDVKAFIDDIEDTFNSIAQTLGKFNIDNLESIETARSLAVDAGESLY